MENEIFFDKRILDNIKNEIEYQKWTPAEQAGFIDSDSELSDPDPEIVPEDAPETVMTETNLEQKSDPKKIKEVIEQLIRDMTDTMDQLGKNNDRDKNGKL